MKFKLEWLQYLVLIIGLIAMISFLCADDFTIMIDDEPIEELIDWS